MELRRNAPLVAVILGMILNLASSEISGEQVYNERKQVPMIIFDFIGERQTPSPFNPFYPYLGKEQPSSQNAFERLEEDENGLQLLQQENVEHREYVEPGELSGEADGGRGDSEVVYGNRKGLRQMDQDEIKNRDPRIESPPVRRRVKPFRTTSPRPFKDEVNFDDSSYAAPESDRATGRRGDADEEQSPLLTLGGYQRPIEKTQYNNERQNISPHKMNNVKKEESGDIKNDAQSSTDSENVARDLYNGEQPQMNRPVMPSPFVNNYNPGLVQPYHGFGYFPSFEYNSLPLSNRMHSSEFIDPLNRGFMPQPIQSNGLTAETPFNAPTASQMQTGRTFQNIPFNPYTHTSNQELNNVRTSYPQNPMFNVPVFYNRMTAPDANLANQSPVPYMNNWNSDNRFIFPPQPEFMPNANFHPAYPDVGNTRFRNVENEHKLQSVGENPGNKPNSAQNANDQYLNYPTQNAGYGTVESLPAPNSAAENKPMDASLPAQGPEFRPPGAHQSFPRLILPFPANNQNPFMQRIAPVEGNENASSNFDTLEYFKNLRQNYPFPTTPGNDDDTIFQRYSQRPVGTPPISTFSSPHLDSNSDDVPSDGRVRTVPSDIYEFLSARGTTSKMTTDENGVPACAKSNHTICFEDPEYPTRQVTYAVDSEALQLQKFLSPATFQGSIGLNIFENEDAPAAEDSEICQADVKQGHPLRAQDVDGKWKIIVNIKEAPRFDGFSQSIRLETCSISAQPCSHTEKSVETRCVQKFSVNRLLAWDEAKGLHMGLFKLPIACVCQIIKIEPRSS